MAESHGTVAGEGDAEHAAAEAVVVVDRVVLGGAVVPERDGARLPAEAAGELRLDLVGEQVGEQGSALRLGPAGEAGGVGGVDVKRLTAGFGMGADDRVLGGVVALDLGAAILDAVLAGSW